MTSVRREIDAVVEELESPSSAIAKRKKFVPKSPEERLLQRRARKARSMRGHTRSYVVMNTFFILMWGVTSLLAGSLLPPWFLFPMLGWGLGFTFHALGYRAWLADNAKALRAAEHAALPPGDRGLDSSRWDSLLDECRRSVAAAREVIQGKHGTEGIAGSLDESLAQAEVLVSGGRELEGALHQVAPGGLADIDARVAAVEVQWNQATDEGLRRAHEQNRTLLVARRNKIASLQAERDRIGATLEGFVLAAENLRLDAARFARGDVDVSALDAPVRRLQEEVDILDKVRAELAALD